MCLGGTLEGGELEAEFGVSEYRIDPGLRCKQSRRMSKMNVELNADFS